MVIIDLWHGNVSIGLFFGIALGIDALKSIGYLIVRLRGQYLRQLELP
jgi:hypothetical protein